MQRVPWYIAKLKSPIRPFWRWVVRHIAARKAPRALLNRYYKWLSYNGKSRFEQRYGLVFRSRGLFGGEGVPLAAGEWSIDFNNREIQLPLRPSWAWLDWVHAVAAIGNDSEVIQTYEALISSDECPTLFLDVGANYGTHSVLLLSAGIPVIAFEPNPTCFPHFQVICELNGLAGRWEQVAIGNRAGQVELVYPEKEAWLGSVSSDIVPGLKKGDNVVTQHVPLKMLDDYLGDVPRTNVLIKIDVEGFEREVIQGASQLLRDCRPKLIFESNTSIAFKEGRDDLFRLLADCGYSVHTLPWRPSAPTRPLDVGEFLLSEGTNFIALPRRLDQNG